MQILGNSYSYQSGTNDDNFRPQYDPNNSPLYNTANGGTLYNINNQKGDTLELSNNMLGNAVVYADDKDTIKLEGNGWHQTGSNIQDDKSQFKGDLYEDSYGHKVLVAHDPGTNAPTVKQNEIMPVLDHTAHPVDAQHQADIADGINKIETNEKNNHNAGAIDGFVTEDEIKTALKDNVFSGSGKDYWSGVVTQMEIDKKVGSKTAGEVTQKAADGQTDLTGVSAAGLAKAEVDNNHNFATLGQGGPKDADGNPLPL